MCITYDDAVNILTSEKTAQVLDDLIKQRESEREELGQEQITIQKEHGSAKKWRKSRLKRDLSIYIQE